MEAIAQDDAKSFSTPAPAKTKSAPKKRGRPPKAKVEQQIAAKAEAQAERLAKEESEAHEKAAILSKITGYMNEFGDRINYRPPKPLSGSSKIEDLRTALAAIELDLSKGGGKEWAKNGFLALMKGLQDYSPVGNLNGPIPLADVANSPEARVEWEPLVTEFAIKYEALFAASVEVRLAGAIALLCVKVHQANTQLAAQQQFMQQMTPDQREELVKKQQEAMEAMAAAEEEELKSKPKKK